jgi:hypothetical protein
MKDLAAKSWPSETPNPDLTKEVKMCITKLYKTDSDRSDSDFSTHENGEFAEEVDWENCLYCIAQSLPPQDLVILKFWTKKTVKCFTGLIQDMDPDSYNTISLNKRPNCWIFCLPKVEDTAVLDLTDIVSKLPHPMVLGSCGRIVTMIVDMNRSSCNIN